MVCGVSDGPTLVLTAGVHGCEYVGIMTLRRLFAQLSPAKIRGRVILLPLVNGEGFYIGSKQALAKTRKSGESRFFDTLKKSTSRGAFFSVCGFRRPLIPSCVYKYKNRCRLRRALHRPEECEYQA
ncbi:succinylglutamate desuccinylase/aspartoacylase family protein [Intestinimonas sp. MSJ-38]|uniref:succinylglutamate desuccinylase/aspartoacylase domain-containing protein n=1 Tax=Intestinimonas sp. MSJ-38 TaxID=2841532 RepID=UPI001C126D0C|nr:succinylglutamate desuccinylase/aspartoacylase family protein [Intestinimonas sp. MSJ-38]MBU5433731.1 succinylglutamate desuccinylase/aspartoacylase family protein [Intestinimonas sp. MSJ-38]